MISDADGGQTRYEYVGDDEFPANPVCPQGTDGKRIQRIHYPGHSIPTENHHGASRRVLRQTGANGIETRFEYQVVGACVTHVDSPGERCTGSHCPRVDSWENHQAGWRIVGGQVTATTVVDAAGERKSTHFDSGRLVTRSTDATGQSLVLRRDAQGRITQRTDPLGRTTRYAHDAKGNPTTIIDPLGRITVVEYDLKWSKPTVITRALEDGTLVTTQLSYDNATGNLTRIIDPLGHITRFTYTDKSQLETHTDALGNVTRLEWSDAGDLVRIIDALGHETRLTPDAVGRTIAHTDPLGFDTAIDYTALDQLDTLTDALGGETRQTFDIARRLTSVTNAAGHPVERYEYDDFGRLVTVRDALNQSTHLDYDTRGLVTRLTDRLGRATDLTHDARGRTASVRHPGGDTTRITRDAAGRVTSVEDDASRIDYRYDGADRLIEETTTNAAGTHSLGYQWDTLDRLTRRTVNGQDPTEYHYDHASRLTAIQYRGTLTTYTWDAANRLTGKTLPNGIHQSLQWDAASRLTRLEYRDSDANLIEAIDYQYDAKGQRTQKASGAASVPETPFQAEYDAADRMTRITLHLGSAEEKTYDLTYDSEGNLTQKRNEQGATDLTTYTWDERGRLTTLSAPGIAASFKYDALNRRVEKTVNGATVRAIHDGIQQIGELARGTIETSYLTGLQIDEMLSRHSTQGARTYLTDALGSILAQTREDQSPQNWYAYSPYGETRSTGDDEGNPVQYTARENDDTGLYYYRARYYDPVLKRFISQDPIGLRAGVNYYGYVLGNPVSYYDPYGLFGMDDVWGGVYWATGGWSPDQSTVDFTAGFGDSISFNITKHIRNAAGICAVSYSSNSYGYGTASGTVFGLANAGRTSLVVYKNINKAKQWRANSRTSRKTREKRIAAAGSYRASRADAALTLVGGSGVDSYVSLVSGVNHNSSNECGCGK